MKTFSKLTILAVAASLTLGLSGCAQDGQVNSQAVGAITGAVAGGLLGSRFGGGTGTVIATGVGALAGAAVGGMIGGYLDKQDQPRFDNALNQADTGSTVGWVNPQGEQYSVKPTSKPYEQTYYVKPRRRAEEQQWREDREAFKRTRYCREFILKQAKIAGSEQQIYGTACRQPDGTWKMEQAKKR